MKKKKMWRSVCLGIGTAWCAVLAGSSLAQGGRAGAPAERGQEVFLYQRETRQEENNLRKGAEEGAEGKTIALTFDDGPHATWTPKLLDGLKERGVKVTFFLMGENIEGNEEIVKRMAQEGHLIGNHSFRHEQLTKAGTDHLCESLEKTGELIRELTGVTPEYVRPPYGDWNEELECRTGLTTVLWNVDSLDWSYRNRSRIADKVCREVEDGDIILMHDIFPTSEEAALDIIDRLSGEGWQFVTVDELSVD